MKLRESTLEKGPIQGFFLVNTRIYWRFLLVIVWFLWESCPHSSRFVGWIVVIICNTLFDKLEMLLLYIKYIAKRHFISIKYHLIT